MPFIKTDFSIPLAELRKDTGKEKAGGEEGGSNNFRPVCLKCRVFEGTPGSAYAEFGETKVLARLKVKGILDTSRIASQLLSVIKTCVMVHKYSQCSFDVEVTVLSDDGGLLQCAIMAATMALADAEVLTVCFDVRGGHLTSRLIDEFIALATEKAMKLYPVLRKALIATLSVDESSIC
ncbi:unnamed protein product [Heligmosomoides polygyrus]|uniref:RNase_PH domain-containing protein n=1 Tax=Heligmosomoides polygyrus TaxID=6339 RepID=A0A183FDS2_HELPZ|nr:unnamed protein product [Heligmosomoides polygyrus]